MDQEITCPCGEKFTHSVNDQEFYKRKGFSAPKYCKPCRDKRKEERANNEL